MTKEKQIMKPECGDTVLAYQLDSGRTDIARVTRECEEGYYEVEADLGDTYITNLVCPLNADDVLCFAVNFFRMLKPRQKNQLILDFLSRLFENQPKQGKWIPTEYPFMAECEDCSVCGFRTAYGLNLNFCPECGAKMEEANIAN